MQKVQEPADLTISLIMKMAKKMARRYGQIGITEPDDLVQMAMLKVLKKNPEEPVTFGWLSRVVRTAAADAGRNASRQISPSWLDDSDREAHSVCENANEQGYLHTSGIHAVKETAIEFDVIPQVKKMLTELPPEQRQALVLQAEGHSCQEIARLTGTNVGTVRTRVFYGRRKAKLLLADFM